MKIVVDAMGGDYAPKTIVAGSIEAINESQVPIILVGQEERIENELKEYDYPKDLLEIMPAPEVVEMHEPATVSIRKKKKSSIAIGINLIKGKNSYAFISAGNTGAVVAASTINLGMLEGVERPAIGLVIPTLKKFSFLIDVGANTAAKSQHLLQSALMAEVYANQVLEIANPSIGLLNIGEEAGKGTGFEKETYQMMKERIPNFIGNIEANEVFKGNADCIICDGFVGNIVIKISQGLMESAAELLKREIKKSPLAILGAFIMKSRLQHIKKLADYSEYGGAPLLGVNGIVMISHGRSDAKAIKNSIKAAVREIKHNTMQNMMKQISGIK